VFTVSLAYSATYLVSDPQLTETAGDRSQVRINGGAWLSAEREGIDADSLRIRYRVSVADIPDGDVLFEARNCNGWGCSEITELAEKKTLPLPPKPLHVE